MRDKRIYLGGLILFYALFLVLLGYFIPRSQFVLGFFTYALLFGLFLLLYDSFGRLRPLYRTLLATSVIFRLLLFFAVPELSDDVYRFIWDGHLLLQGINPYVHLPVDIISSLEIADSEFFRDLFKMLNSQAYHSVYPPTNQLIFMIGAAIGQESVFGSILVIRTILLGFDLAVMLMLHKLAKVFNRPRCRVLLYALNPLVILEITGNLHFEGIVLFFVLLTLWYWYIKHKGIGIAFGTAIGIKLTPILLAPLLFLRSEGYLRKWLILGTLSTVLILFIPLAFSWEGYLEALKLYHGKFEFNASVYFIFRDLIMVWLDFNPIAYLSPLLTLLSALLIIWMAVKRKFPLDLLQGSVWTYMIYFLLHTVIHPWYIIIPLGLAVLTNYKSLTIWSLMIFTSYEAYSIPQTESSAALRFIQYLILGGAIIFDLKRSRPGSVEQR